jgi:hypothetical protein
MNVLRRSALVVLISLSPSLSWGEDEEEGTAYVPDEKVGTPGKPDGVDWRIEAGLDLMLADNRNVIGQDEGTTVTFGYKSAAQLDARENGHESRNRALVVAGVNYSPVIDDFRKSRDEVSFETIYLYHIVDWFGPFVRAAVQSVMLQGFDARRGPTTYSIARVDGSTETVTLGCPLGPDLAPAPCTRRLELTEPWRPTRFKQSLGLFAQPLAWQPVSIETRAGVGAREVLAAGQLAGNDDPDTAVIELVELRDIWQAGGEGVVEIWGDLEEKRVAYRASAEVLVPFAQTEPLAGEDKSIVDYAVVELRAALSFKLVSWAALDYELGALREPLLLDAWQVRNQLLLHFGVLGGNVPPEDG